MWTSTFLRKHWQGFFVFYSDSQVQLTETYLLNYKGLSGVGRYFFKDEAPIKNQPLYFAWTLEIEHIPFLLKLPTSLCSRTRPWVLFFRTRGLDDATDFSLFPGPFEDEMRSLDLFLTILTTGRDFWSMFFEVEARNSSLRRVLALNTYSLEASDWLFEKFYGLENGFCV